MRMVLLLHHEKSSESSEHISCLGQASLYAQGLPRDSPCCIGRPII